MANAEALTITLVVQLINFNSIYLLGYAWLLGMSVWVTFFGGIIALRTLPPHHFNALQRKTFPVYFVISIINSSALLGMWIWKHPDVVQQLSHPKITDVAQAYTLASVLFFQGLNYFLIAPMTSKTVSQRQKLEKEEGKVYSDPGVSEGMKALNRCFAKLHGMSALANLSAVIALLFHGLWIGNAGVNGY